MAVRWNIPARDPEADRILAQALGTSPILAALVRHRGLSDPAAARAYLQPRLTELEDPANLIDMPKAAERLRRAIQNRERIIVYGDYDVDGMTGTVVLLNFIRLAGGLGESYIPDREKEGYSFNDDAIDGFLGAASKPGLIVTVDHGTSAAAGISRLRQGGIDVIVTDHHHPPPDLPQDAAAVVNPRRPDCPSQWKSLCGAAVAFKLAWATAQSFSGERKVSPEFRTYLIDAMALVSLATVTDVVPLQGENRVLCFHGLRAVSASSNPGIRALLQRSRLEGQAVRAVHVGFRLGPRLNAAGRMGLVPKAIELLTTPDFDRAQALAGELEDANLRRRAVEQEMLQEALEDPVVKSCDGQRGICIGREGWHVGVIGIVAARLVDRFHVPALVFALNGAKSRGSARAKPGVHLARMFAELGPHLSSHGGHAGAAGCTLEAGRFAEFQAAFHATSARHLATSSYEPTLDIDLELPFTSIRAPMVEELEMLAPHGEGNAPARFCTRNVEIVGTPRVMGRDRTHLAFYARQEGQVFRAVAFGAASQAPLLSTPGRRFDLAYRLKFDTYKDPGAIELEIEDFRPR